MIDFFVITAGISANGEYSPILHVQLYSLSKIVIQNYVSHRTVLTQIILKNNLLFSVLHSSACVKLIYFTSVKTKSYRTF